MVNAVRFSQGRGIREWFLQRITSLIITFYSLIFLVCLLRTPHLSYIQWSQYFDSPMIRIATLISFFALLLHAWLGAWRVSVDYIPSAYIRVTLNTLLAFLFGGCLIRIIEILWGL